MLSQRTVWLESFLKAEHRFYDLAFSSATLAIYAFSASSLLVPEKWQKIIVDFFSLLNVTKWTYCRPMNVECCRIKDWRLIRARCSPQIRANKCLKLDWNIVLSTSNRNIYLYLIPFSASISLSFLDRPICHFTLSNAKRFYSSRESRCSGWERVNWVYLPISLPYQLSLSLLDRPLCYFTLSITPNDFTRQGRASGWRRVIHL